MSSGDKYFGFDLIQRKTLARIIDEVEVEGSSVTWDNVTSKPAVIAAGADQAAARAVIGAGTSNLALGTTSSTAKAGDYAPTWAEVTGKPAVIAAGADQATARAAIGAGTSNLALGTTGTTALAGNGNAASATVLQTGRTIGLSGGATGTSPAFNGSANAVIPVTLAAPTSSIRGGALQQQLPAVPDPVTKTWFDDTLYPVLIATGVFTAPA